MTLALMQHLGTLAQSPFDWLMGLRNLRWSSEQAEVGWRYPLPAWGWLLVFIVALLVGAWSYNRMLGRVGSRTLLAVVRALLLVVIAALLAGPMLVLPQEQVEPDSLLVLVDRSASMQIRDVSADGHLISRDESVTAALQRQADVFSSDQLGRDRRIVWLGFDAGVFPYDPPIDADSTELPNGRHTAIRTAIEQALERAGGRPVSGIVLLSDGRSPQITGTDLVRRLQQQAVSVFSVPVGAQATPLDFAIGRVEAPEQAFINDVVPVRVWIDRYPPERGFDPGQLRVLLIDTATGKVLDQVQPTAQEISSDAVRLSAQSEVAGPVTWRVQVIYQPPAGQEKNAAHRELVLDNNVRDVSLDLIDRAIRVLLVEGYPRWEYRYLKSLLVREKSIQSSILLISADPNFAQEGDMPITRLPADAQEMQPFDVIIIGDVPPDYFSTEHMTLLRDHVASQGAGLLFVGGQQHMPRSYEGTPLVDLLPMRQAASVDWPEVSSAPMKVTPTPLAETLSVLRLITPGVATDSRTRSLWPRNLPGLLWAQRLGVLKPTSEVLANAQSEAEAVQPLIVRLRYGAGQSLYVGTDDTWRWRFGKGELYFEQFWTQLIQMLGRQRVQRNVDGLWFDLSHRRLELDQPLVVRLRVDDPLLLKRELPRVAVDVLRADDPQGQPLERIELLPRTEAAAGGPGSSQSAGVEFEALWRPTIAGNLVLRVVEAALDDRNLSEQVEVIHPEDELRQPATDHQRLAYLASETGGQVVPLEQLDQLPSLVPNRARRTPIDIREPLWDSPLALIIVVSLLTLEWIGRKWIRLA